MFSMKKLFLFTAALAAFSTVQAQNVKALGTALLNAESGAVYEQTMNAQLKTAATTDTGFFTYSVFMPRTASNIYYRRVFDSTITARVDAAAPNDSGYFFGTNPFLNRGYAEQFHFRYKTDTGMQILGFRTLFTGRVQRTSTKQLTFGIWSRSAQSAAGTKKFNSGLPGVARTTLTIPARNIGAGAGIDTFKNFYFQSPYVLNKAVDSDFFMGYTMPQPYTWSASSLANDTFGIRSSGPGKGIGVGSFLNSTNDTIHRNQNVFMNANGAWDDMYWNYIGSEVNLSIVPIVKLTGSLSVDNGFTTSDLTFFGNYPNPASDRTKIKFSLQSAATVSLVITDLNGRTIRTEPAQKLGAGVQELELNVSDLAAGNYVYVLTSANGGAIASQLTVIR
jgi:hypothetical protein